MISVSFIVPCFIKWEVHMILKLSYFSPFIKITVSKKSIGSSSNASQFRRRDSDSNISLRELPTQFSIRDIYRATGNFSTENQIGHGGFGSVYKGKLRNGSLIAIKRAQKVTTKV